LPAVPHDPRQVRQVLRYWLALVRQEEALADRPRARAPIKGEFALDQREPRPGVPYFKLGFDASALGFLLRTQPSLDQPVDAERTAFLSHWLRLSYQRETASVFGRPEPRGQQIHVGFPTFFARRTEELSALFRFPGLLTWQDAEGAAWVPADYAARKAGALPEPPTSLHLSVEKATEEGGPYFLDTQVLTRVLGVNEEELADFFGVLREVPDLTGLDVVAAVCDLLERRGQWSGPFTRSETTPAALAERLLAAIRRHLPPGDVTVFPVGLVTDDSRIQASFHLQRDLLVLLKSPPGEPGSSWDRSTPLWHYLAGDPASAGHQLPRGLRQPRALTEGQLDAAARFLGSTLAAAQGPPGTGKTDLILQLVADTLVARIRRLSEGRAMGQTLLLVTSTNNRAVDNVLESLSNADTLPMGLRAGNLEVTAALTTETLVRTRDWLKRQDTTDARERHAAALAEFEAALAELDAALAPFEAATSDRSRRTRLTTRLADLDEQLRTAVGTADELEAARKALKPLRRILGDVEQILSKSLEKAAERAAALWRSKVREKGLDTELAAALAPLGLALELDLPPAILEDADPEEAHEAWDDAVEAATEATDALHDQLVLLANIHQTRKQRDAVAAELADLEVTIAQAPAAPPPLVGLHTTVFTLAERVRQTWAIHNSGPIETALRKAIDRTANRGSLRSLFEKDPETALWVRRLFPVMGCTLLSLGNLFPPEAGIVERVVIDEAGQCHPAYALAALMRAERALVIGDVHQLQPVVRLTALDEQRIRRATDIGLDDTQLGPYRVFAENPASAQALADRAVKVRPVLRDHFRCQPAIISLSDRLCGYRLTVHTPERSLQDRIPWLVDPVMLAAVRGEQIQARGSWSNPAEADMVMEIMRQLRLRGIGWEQVAILTPYVGQLDLIRQKLRQVGAPLEDDREVFTPQPDLLETGTLATGTVHRFQGGERTIVLFSTVVGRDRSLGFLNTRVNLVNVAVSRARDHLIIVGDPETLARGPFTRVLVERAVPIKAG
jgi:hypothetical protein